MIPRSSPDWLRPTGPRSLVTRLVLGAAGWCAFLLVAGGLALSNVFRISVEQSFDDQLRVLMESLIATVRYQTASGLELRRPLADPRFERAFSGWYWQVVSPDGQALRSRSLWDSEFPRPPQALGPGTVKTATGPNDEPLRVLTRGVRLPGQKRVFQFIVAGATGEIAAQRSRFNRILTIALAILGAGLMVALLVQIRYGLAPLRAMSVALAAIRAGRRERLAGAFPTEIQPLARELDALLEQNARVVQRARKHVGNLAHGLKTPLSVLRNISFELAASENAAVQAKSIEQSVQLMQFQIDHYLARARTAGPRGLTVARTPVRPVIDDLARTLTKLYPDKSVALSVQCADTTAFAGDRQDLEEVLGNLLDNAFKWARSRVYLEARAEAGPREAARRDLQLTLDDDGPGLPTEARDAVLQRGKRLDTTVPGSGLGLDIVRDITELYAGRVRLDRAPLGGLRVQVVLPAAE